MEINNLINRMKKVLVSIFVLMSVFVPNILAQNNDEHVQNDASQYIIDTSKVEIHTDSLTLMLSREDSLTYDELKSRVGKYFVVSPSLIKAENLQLEKNKSRRTQGYRIRIFFDNKRDAREISKQIISNFNFLYPDVPAYREYANPYFEVTVGDFRTKSEAMKFMQGLKKIYPSVFIVRDYIFE